MKTLTLLIMHVLTTLAQRVGPGGIKGIIAESVLLKHQQLIACRAGGKTLKLTTADRFLFGFLVLFLHPRRIQKAAVVLNPATLAKFRRALLSHNYHLLFSTRKNGKPGPKGPSDDLVRVIVEMKKRNTRFGCPRIAQQINLAFGLNIDKDVVRRVLAKHYRPNPFDGGPSWLTFFRHTAESLGSLALFQRKSMLRKILSRLIAISQYTRRIISFSIAGCRFDQTVSCSLFTAGMPRVEDSKSLYPAHDRPFRHHRVRRNRLDVDRIQRLAMFPRAPPFMERRIRTSRRNHHGYRSNRSVIDRETEHAVFHNDRTLFLMQGPRDEIGSLEINRETAIDLAESQIFAQEKHIQKEQRIFIAA